MFLRANVGYLIKHKLGVKSKLRINTDFQGEEDKSTRNGRDSNKYRDLAKTTALNSEKSNRDKNSLKYDNTNNGHFFAC